MPACTISKVATAQHTRVICAGITWLVLARKKKRKDYAFQHQFNEKPSIIPGCPMATVLDISSKRTSHLANT